MDNLWCVCVCVHVNELRALTGNQKGLSSTLCASRVWLPPRLGANFTLHQAIQNRTVHKWEIRSQPQGTGDGKTPSPSLAVWKCEIRWQDAPFFCVITNFAAGETTQ